MELLKLIEEYNVAVDRYYATYWTSLSNMNQACTTLTLAQSRIMNGPYLLSAKSLIQERLPSYLERDAKVVRHPYLKWWWCLVNKYQLRQHQKLQAPTFIDPLSMRHTTVACRTAAKAELTRLCTDLRHELTDVDPAIGERINPIIDRYQAELN